MTLFIQPKCKSGIAAKSKVLHPNSRQAMQLCRQTHHVARTQKNQKNKSIKVEIQGDKLNWFHEHLDKETTSYTTDDVLALITRYSNRFNEELEQIEIVNSIKGRRGQQHVARKNAIELTVEREREEHEAVGLEIPDLINAKNLKAFREWSGEMRFVQNIKMRRVKMDSCTISRNTSDSGLDEDMTDSTLCVESASQSNASKDTPSADCSDKCNTSGT